MARFRFRCLSRQSRQPLEAGIFLEDNSLGFTPLNASGWLELNTPQTGELEWFATLWHHRVAQGCSLGGDYEILVDEHTLRVEANASDFDHQEALPPVAR
jgi:hypothetical protein